MLVLGRDEYPVEGLAFGPGGRLAAGGHAERGWSKARTAVWDLGTGGVVAEWEPNWPGPDTLAFHPATGWLFFTPRYTGLTALTPAGDLRYPPELGLYEDPPSGREYVRGQATAVAIHPDGNRVVAAYTDPARYYGLAGAGAGLPHKVWEVGGHPWDGSENARVRSLAYLPDGSRFLAVEYDRHGLAHRPLAVRDGATGQLVEVAPNPSGEPAQVAASPDGRWVVVRGGRSLHAIPADDLRAEPRKVRNPANRHFTAMAFHPSGRYLAATSNDETVKVFDAETWQLATTYTWQVGRLRSVAFSPDGQLAAVGSDTGKVVVWDVDL